jgi:hypothetical protein
MIFIHPSFTLRNNFRASLIGLNALLGPNQPGLPGIFRVWLEVHGPDTLCMEEKMRMIPGNQEASGSLCEGWT